jgi:hypothetical protein
LPLKEVANLAGKTCWTANIVPDITEYSWNAYKSYINCSSVAWADATVEQKQALSTWATTTVVNNPYNPFYDKDAYNSVYNSMVSWDAYYNKFKNYANDGITPLPVESQGTNVQPNSRVCVPRFLTIGLGANDGIYMYDDCGATEVKALADVLKSQIDANNYDVETDVIILNFGYPASQIPEHHPNISQLLNPVTLSAISNAYTRNKNLIRLIGNLTNQTTTGVYYCPVFFTQGFDTSRTHKDESFNTDTEYVYSWCNEDVHPGAYAHKQIGYQLYSLIMYLLSQEN